MNTAAFAMAPHLLDFVFDPAQRASLEQLVSIDTTRSITSIDQLDDHERETLELLITGWSAPRLGPAEFDRMPSLRAIVHWAGAVDFIDPCVTERGIAVSTGRAANAIPVAEWSVAMIVLAAKDAFWMSRSYCANPHVVYREEEVPRAGLYRTPVGIVGASSIGTLTMEMLKAYDVDVLLYHPRATPERARAYGAELVDDLIELASRSRILSIHAASLPQTRGMISREVLAALPDDATVINTSRGALIDQEALVEELQSGRIRAVLDVTEPDFLPPGHPLYSLPNVFLTPHLAGSVGVELERLGVAAVGEVRRFVNGQPFDFPVQP